MSLEGGRTGLPGGFLEAPEGWVPAEARVIRPSLWAGLEAIGRLVGLLLPILVPLAASTFFGFDGRPETRPFLLVFYGRLELVAIPLLVAVPVARIAFTRYVIDDDGLRVSSSLLQRSDQRVPWDKVTALRHRRSLLGALVGIETLEVVAYGRKGTTLRLVGLRGAAELRTLVATRMRRTATITALVSND